VFSNRLQWDLPINPLAALIQQKKQRDEKILDLTNTNPTRAGIPSLWPEIQEALQHPDGRFYDPQPLGLPAAREAIAKYYAGWNQTVDPDQILVTASTSESYSFLLKLLTNPGDHFLVPTPSYPLFDFLAGLDLAQIHPYPLLYKNGKWQADWQFVADRMDGRTRGVVVVNPNNPTGHYTQASDWATLDEICSQRGVPIISDEVFFDYSLDTATGALVLECRKSNVFSLNGFSKMLGQPQLKLGWIAFSGPDEKQVRDRLELIADTYLSVTTSIQLAAPKLLALRDQLQSPILQRSRNNWQSVRSMALPQEAGWSAILPLSSVWDEEQVAMQLLQEKNLHVQPGYFFDIEGNHLVISLLTPEADLQKGTMAIQPFL
jgi:alanine-synthesizing transaminase